MDTPNAVETKPPLESRIGKDSPFTFGQRLLTEDKDVFDHNAWDHVEWGQEQIDDAEKLIAKQYELPVKDFDKKLYNSQPAKYWDIFYRNNRENFFKDRKWLQIEFPFLYEATGAEYNKPVTILENLDKVLKPGGQILFRDYGRYDLAQVRFKKGRLLDENFYIRGDGTRVYFFTEEELRTIFCTEGPFAEKNIATDRRLLVNRKKQLKMYRIWLQAVFQKPE
ncbi:hypothetical protein HF325_003227 [Metschnikowia pulcherrima]|uniref:Methyltransferase-like protein n=1 Tax=Metschnikowia pulcherrima TaxID=27326 RepID=A0A8H7LEQ1_9ASCO|nr:hypothetical protein HF325_003227 [Metschnikowia pulcherrima]